MQHRTNAGWKRRLHILMWRGLQMQVCLIIGMILWGGTSESLNVTDAIMLAALFMSGPLVAFALGACFATMIWGHQDGAIHRQGCGLSVSDGA